MQKSLFLLTLITSFLYPLFLFAEEGFIGENPGFDFYSKIDEGNYKVLQKTVNKRLQETPTLEVFWKKCAQASSLLKGIPATPEMLDSIQNLDYTAFYAQVLKNAANNPTQSSITTDVFQDITTCLTSQYNDLKSDAQKETNARITISYIGLYMDGDKNNSEYDIITDIEKINWLIFSEDLKYEGTSNAAGKWLKDFLSNKAIAPLFPLSNITANGTAVNPATNITINGSVIIPPGIPSTTISADMRALLGGTCSTTTPIGPVSSIMDDAFLADLSSVLASGGGGGSIWGGYTPSIWQSPSVSGPTSGGTKASQTSAGDFFHEMPCTSLFCIKIKMVPWSTNALGGSKNISIEGILDKHIKIMQPISESALGCEVMTNNTASSPKKWLNLPNTIAGLKVFLDETPQKTRRDKREATPERDAQELKDIQRCSYASAGLSTDEARSRSIGGAWYSRTSGYTSETIKNGTTALGPQESAELARFTNCTISYMDTGRKSYYDSFSTDLTEIQAYSANMLNQINNIVSTLTQMNSKKDTCS